MSKAKDLRTYTGLVKSILEEDQQTRNSDSYLYLKVLRHIASEKDILLDDLTVPDFLVSMNVLGMPCFETIRRTRQKLQEKFPELSAKETVQEFRAENERGFREFARGGLSG